MKPKSKLELASELETKAKKLRREYSKEQKQKRLEISNEILSNLEKLIKRELNKSDVKIFTNFINDIDKQFILNLFNNTVSIPATSTSGTGTETQNLNSQNSANSQLAKPTDLSKSETTQPVNLFEGEASNNEEQPTI